MCGGNHESSGQHVDTFRRIEEKKENQYESNISSLIMVFDITFKILDPFIYTFTCITYTAGYLRVHLPTSHVAIYILTLLQVPPLLAPSPLLAKKLLMSLYVVGCVYARFNACPVPGTMITSNDFALGKYC